MCSQASAVTKARGSCARWVRRNLYFIWLFLLPLKSSCYSVFFLKDNLKIVLALEFFSLQKIFKSHRNKFDKNTVVLFRAGFCDKGRTKGAFLIIQFSHSYCWQL